MDLSGANIYFFTGIPGTCIRRSLREKFIPFVQSQLGQPSGREPILCELESELEVLAEPYVKRLDPQTGEPKSIVAALRLPKPLLARLWRQANESVLQQAQRANRDGRDAYVTFHACWFHPTTEEFIALADPKLLFTFGARCLITLVDDVYDNRARLLEDNRLLIDELGSEAAPELQILQALRQLRQILQWRGQEIFVSEQLAYSAADGKHFLFPVKHPCLTLLKLLYKSEVPRVYVSHPIAEPRRMLVSANRSHRTEAHGCIKSITELSAVLRERFTLFEPTTIDELRPVATSLEGREVPLPALASRWPLAGSEGELLWIKPRQYHDSEAFDFNLSPALGYLSRKGANPKKKVANKIIQAVAESTRDFIAQIEDQINARDHKLVEQANGIAVFRPLYRGNRSGGVMEEVTHLHKLVSVGLVAQAPACVISCPVEDRRAYPGWELGQLIEGWIERGIIQLRRNSDKGAIANFRQAIRDGKVHTCFAGASDPALINKLLRIMQDHGLRLILPQAWKKAHAGPLGGAYAKLQNQWLDQEAKGQLQEALSRPPYLDRVVGERPDFFLLDDRLLTGGQYGTLVAEKLLHTVNKELR